MANDDITSLIAGLQLRDPKLYQALMALQSRVYDVETELFPLVRQAAEISATDDAVIAPATFTFSFTSRTVRFNWSQADAAAQYEIRKGDDWDTASFQLRSTSLQADIDPLLVGSHTYLIKSMNRAGNYSPDYLSCVVTVPALGTITVNTQVIDNNVLLSWVAPTSVFDISYYNVYRDGDLLGTLLGTFFVRFEAVAGTYVYNIVAVDVAGNVSGDVSVPVTVTAPPDYVLQDQRTSDLMGSRVNVSRENSPALLACTNMETWADHFLGRAWSSPRNQTDAGFPIYIQPTAATGSYVEEIDYGVVLNNVIATITWQLDTIVPDVTITVSTETSLDGAIWTAPALGSSIFVATMRYLRLTLTFTATT